MGRVGKGTMCSVVGCDGEAVRSISVSRAKAAGLDVEGRRAYLCKEHYKTFKKESREERRIERWRHGVS